MERLRALVAWVSARGPMVFVALAGLMMLMGLVALQTLAIYQDIADRQCYEVVTGSGASYDCIARGIAAEKAFDSVSAGIGTMMLVGLLVLLASISRAHLGKQPGEAPISRVRVLAALVTFTATTAGIVGLSIWWYANYHY